MRHLNHLRTYASIAGIILLTALGYGAYQFIKTTKALEDTESRLNLSIEKIVELEKQNEELGGTLSLTQSEKEELGGALAKQKEENEELEEEKDMLEKLAKTDKQLLAKYSKVYFLNENYFPTKLDTIDEKYTLPAGKKIEFLDPALPYLEDLLEDAEEDGMPLRIVSAYRSFEEQQSLKSSYRVLYGSGANSFSADQGYSEHQLGTTVDFGTPQVPGAMGAFASTASYTWLIENAHKYGFILSYPKSNSYYIYEPWHWRFVGEDLARDLYKDKKNFYDMDQREIDEYLIKIFD
jgi:LAS superfamily LD-carboxypeptidase LdcB